MQSHILIIDDDAELGDLLQRSLQTAGYVVDRARSSLDLPLAAVISYDLVIAEVVLPGRSGLELCRSIRAYKTRTRVLLLSTLSSVEDKVTGLNAGADDYVAKPFEFPELVARVRALLRTTAKKTEHMEIADLKIDFVGYRVWRGLREIKLTATQFGILGYLCRNAGRVVRRAELIARVWTKTRRPSSNAIDAHISALRAKLEPSLAASLIRTVHGEGYVFEPTSSRPRTEPALPPAATVPLFDDSPRPSLVARRPSASPQRSYSLPGRSS